MRARHDEIGSGACMRMGYFREGYMITCMVFLQVSSATNNRPWGPQTLRAALRNRSFKFKQLTHEIPSPNDSINSIAWHRRVWRGPSA